MKAKVIYELDENLKRGLFIGIQRRIKHIVESTGMPQSSIAAIMGFNKAYFSFIVNGRIAAVPDKTLRLIALSFRINAPASGWRLIDEMLRASDDNVIDKIALVNTDIGGKTIDEWEVDYQQKVKSNITSRYSFNKASDYMSEKAHEEKEAENVNSVSVNAKTFILSNEVKKLHIISGTDEEIIITVDITRKKI